MKQAIPLTPASFDHTRVIERPDGFYWREEETLKEYGPYATLFDAVQDMEYRDEDALESENDLEAVENDLGLADWIDPDTGEPAEDGFTHLPEY
jgi:hypothetical protein